MLENAKPTLFRLLGPNRLGLMVPHIGLNASFSHLEARKGNIALISQSGAICTTVLDWAFPREIGFSYFVSVGNSADIDIADVVDYVANDPQTHSILLYIESVKNGSKFVSAMRAAARNKPIVAIKVGRFPAGAKAATTHTGALSGADDIFEAVLKRVGVLRVYDIEELFSAVETLGHINPEWGERLAVVTNGGGLGVIAADELAAKGGQPAQLSDKTIAALNEVLPSTWSHENPVDIIGDAASERYEATLKILLAAEELDTILVMHAPVGIVDGVKVAQTIIDLVGSRKQKILTVWAGEQVAHQARQLFSTNQIPAFETPSQAISAFMHYLQYKRNQLSLIETPSSLPEEFKKDSQSAHDIIQTYLKTHPEGGVLSDQESKNLLSCYDVPIIETFTVNTPEQAIEKAKEIGFPIALKIYSPDITHKSDVGGVGCIWIPQNKFSKQPRPSMSTLNVWT